MPTITLTVNLPGEMTDQIIALPENQRAIIAEKAFLHAFSALPTASVSDTAPKMSWAELVAAGTGTEAAAKQNEMFAQWANDVAQTTDNEPTLEMFMANLNENRRLSGEEPVYRCLSKWLFWTRGRWAW